MGGGGGGGALCHIAIGINCMHVMLLLEHECQGVGGYCMRIERLKVTSVP